MNSENPYFKTLYKWNSRGRDLHIRARHVVYSCLTESPPWALQGLGTGLGFTSWITITSSATVMVSESEALLRAAAKIAADDIASGRTHGSISRESTIIHVVIKGLGSWTVDTLGDIREASQLETSPGARLHLTYASEDVFLGLAHK